MATSPQWNIENPPITAHMMIEKTKIITINTKVTVWELWIASEPTAKDAITDIKRATTHMRNAQNDP